jgi:predicted nucleotidyltransferase component of viral defense system
MLDFQQIKAGYPEQLQGFERAILREYLQFKILQALFESDHAAQLSFLGGTALRIVYDNTRFSEDIDLDNFGLSQEGFGEIVQSVKRFMELEGFEVEVKQVARGAYHCYLRFPELLFEHGLSPHQAEKILIQIDTAAQGYDYQPDIRILNKFDVFTEVRVTPEDVLLSQKIYTAVNRERPKGRDFYDITFLLGRTTPDYGFLELKMGVSQPEAVREQVLEEIKAHNFEKLAEDVAPFLISPDEVKRVVKFRPFWEQAKLA